MECMFLLNVSNSAVCHPAGRHDGAYIDTAFSEQQTGRYEPAWERGPGGHAIQQQRARNEQCWGQRLGDGNTGGGN